jgi:alpha-L-rhamnosidase
MLVYTAYPAHRTALFESDRPVLSAIWDAAWRTLQLSAQDTFVSDLYWERIQYIGDTRLQALAWLALTGDDRLVRLALEQFDQSRAPFGLTQSRYPADLEQYTPLYSLVWINMVHDYWMHRKDDAFTRQFLPGISQVLDWFGRQRNAEGMIPPLFHLDFVDSGYGQRWREILEKENRPGMAIHTLFYALALEDAARLFEQNGRKIEAGQYRVLAAECRRTVVERCYSRARGLFADSPEQIYFSQQANILAILADAVPRAEQQALLDRLLADHSLLPVQLYFRFYLGRAMRKVGRGDLYVGSLGPWEAMLRDGMKTFGEIDGEPRSECHPWSATPAYEFLATVAGIEPSSPGFHTVRIAPSLGSLRRVHARMPHPLGEIELSLERTGPSELTGRVTLPEGLTGVFVWDGREMPIAGTREILFR